MKKRHVVGLLAVTLTLVASLAFAQSGWKFPLPCCLTTGSILYAVDGNTMGAVDAVASGQVLTSAGTGTKPAYSATPTLTSLTLAGNLTGSRQQYISAASGTTVLTTAQSGALVANTGTSATTTFTLPDAAAGLNYCFVEAGDAAGELLLGVGADDVVVGKTHGAENGTGIATAAGTGIKNTAATNVKGDFTCLTAVDATTWVMTSVAGVWASR